MDGDEVAQVYIKYPGAERMPIKELKGFKRVHIAKGKERTIQFRIPVSELQKWDIAQKKWMLYPGDYTVSIGSSSQGLMGSTMSDWESLLFLGFIQGDV